MTIEIEVITGSSVSSNKKEIVLSDEHWDCKCEENYIQSIKSPSCRECGALKKDQPNSRSEEVIAMLVLNKITKGYRK